MLLLSPYITYGNNLICYWATWAFKDICELWVYIPLELQSNYDNKTKPCTCNVGQTHCDHVKNTFSSQSIYQISQHEKNTLKCPSGLLAYLVVTVRS